MQLPLELVVHVRQVSAALPMELAHGVSPTRLA